MCGIAGQVSSDGVDPQLLHAMREALHHRGPDGGGEYVDGNGALAMRRLAILDVAGGDQPIYNEDKSIIIVFNGEIYNFQELRANLVARGHRFSTNTDTECVVHLYEEDGEDCVQRLRGMFAFAIYDKPRDRLFLARDRVGKKPLYYRLYKGGIAFASELKALIQDPTVPRSVDLVALHHFLTLQYVPAPWSIYEGIRKLPPAHTLLFENGRPMLRRYWRLDFSPGDPMSEDEAAEELRRQILEATGIRLMSERPIGAFLSGGVDSSIVVAAMAQQTSGPVKTFSIGFEESAFDERHYARRVASLYGTDHTEHVVRASALDVLPTLVWHYDEPFADSSAIPTFYVAQVTREQVTVALNGDGGDESFGGYRRYVANAMAARFPLPSLLHPLAARLGRALASRGAPRSVMRLSGQFLRMWGGAPEIRYAKLMSYFDTEQKHSLYTSRMREATRGIDSYALIEQAYAESSASDLVNRTLEVDINTYLPGDLLYKVDIATMANSLEARSPLLDQRLMEFAARLPSSLKVRGRATKYLLKKAAEPWLPRDLLRRPKMGFGVPLESWLRGELKDLAWDALTDSTARSRGLFEPAAVRGILEAHGKGEDHSSRIWALLQFELWHRMFVDERRTTAPSPLKYPPR